MLSQDIPFKHKIVVSLDSPPHLVDDILILPYTEFLRRLWADNWARLIRFIAYYANWYHSVIRTLLGIIDFANDYAALGRSLQPAITTRQARILAYANYIF